MTSPIGSFFRIGSRLSGGNPVSVKTNRSVSPLSGAFLLLGGFLFLILNGCSAITMMRTKELREVQGEVKSVHTQVADLQKSLDELNLAQGGTSSKMKADLTMMLRDLASQITRLQAQIDERLSASKVEAEASRLGMANPNPNEITYLSAADANAARLAHLLGTDSFLMAPSQPSSYPAPGTSYAPVAATPTSAPTTTVTPTTTPAPTATAPSSSGTTSGSGSSSGSSGGSTGGVGL